MRLHHQLGPGRIVLVAAIIPIAANADGRPEIIGLGIGRSEAETFWSGVLRSLVKRGLKGVKLVTSELMTVSPLSQGWSAQPGDAAAFTS